MMEPTEAKTLQFTRGAGRSEWYRAEAMFGQAYIVAKNGDRWEYVRPGCGSQPVNRPYKADMWGAIDECQKHFNESISKWVSGPVESKRPKLPTGVAQ